MEAIQAVRSDSPVRIRALGQFVVETPQAPQGVRTRSRNKPLELLKLLVALGGKNVPVQQIVDALWPDADGERANWAFATTLRRLRHLIAADTVELHGGQLGLSLHCCWLDVRAVGAALANAGAAMDGGDTQAAADQVATALELYRGPLLQGESDAPMVMAARDRLHGALMRQVKRLGGLLVQAGQEDSALALYRRALEVESSAEWLYQDMLRCLKRTGRISEGIALYERCRRMLASHLDAAPSAATEALRQALLDDRSDAPARSELPSVAVMPFESPPGAASDQYFASGLGDDIKFALSKISGLTVFSKRTTDLLWAQGASSRRVAEELGAQYVVAGSVRRMGPRVRVTVSIIEGDTGKQVCADQFDRAAEELYLVQDEIVDQIVTALRVQLVEGEQLRYWRKSLRSPEARDRFYRGLVHLWRMTPESLMASRGHFAEVARLAPDTPHGDAYLGWSYLFELLHCKGADVAHVKERARFHARRAMQIDPHAATVNAILGHVSLLDGNGEVAIALGTEAIRQRPGCSVSHAFLGMSLLFLGRPLEAITRVRAAMRLCPMYPAWYGELLGWAYLISGSHEQAAAAALGTLQGDPEGAGAHLILASARHEQGRHAEASELMDRLRRFHPGFDVAAFVAAKPGQGPDLLGQALAWLNSTLI